MLTVKRDGKLVDVYYLGCCLPKWLADKYHVSELGFSAGRTMTVMAISTGKIRCPKKGEWYLVGDQSREAYIAFEDIDEEFVIAELVKIKAIVTTTYVVVN